PTHAPPLAPCSCCQPKTTTGPTLTHPSQFRPAIFRFVFKDLKNPEPQLTRIPAEKITFPFFEQSVISEQHESRQTSH
ncbi:MAG: hypothetical protein ACN6O5_01305, partial [Achromobacter sp.]|uniref:hypothetical protein n=1 Tax=Achromobacter sp. TaxID=134375 RepID=UPI003D000D85